LGNGQDRFAIDRHWFAVDGFCACVLYYGLENFFELLFAFRRNWRFRRMLHGTSVANLTSQQVWLAMGSPIQPLCLWQDEEAF